MLIPFLPRKHEYVIKIRLSALQRKLYQHFLDTFVFPEGTLGKKGMKQSLMWTSFLQLCRSPEGEGQRCFMFQDLNTIGHPGRLLDKCCLGNSSDNVKNKDYKLCNFCHLFRYMHTIKVL